MKKWNILLIDDDDYILDIYSGLLAGLGDTIITDGVNSNAAAFEMLNNNVYDLIISDYIHIGGNGVEFISKLRADLQSINRRTPAIAITGLVNYQQKDAKQNELELYQAGFNKVLPKPFDTRDFVEAIHYLIPERIDPDQALINYGRETPTLDYKEEIDFSDKTSIAALAKDIIAMGNIGGGNIVIGIKENPKGSFHNVGIVSENLRFYESTNLNKLIRSYIEPSIHIDSIIRTIEGKHFVFLLIPKYIDTPLLASRSNEKANLFTGRIYIRNTACESSEIKKTDEMRNFINRYIKEKSPE